jgi:hypothetical protein
MAPLLVSKRVRKSIRIPNTADTGSYPGLPVLAMPWSVETA